MTTPLQQSGIAILVSLGLLVVFFGLLAGLRWLLIGNTHKPATIKQAVDGILAPANGTIVAIQVQPGETVAFGQSLCVYDTGSQKIAVRAAKPGLIGAIHVTSGGKITRGQLLMEFQHGAGGNQ